MTSVSNVKRRLGGWLPDNESVLAGFRRGLAAKAKAQRGDVRLKPVVQQLANLIHDDPFLRMGFTNAINQALAADFDLGYQSIDELVLMINQVITMSSPFSTSELVGCPLNALLDWPMCMPAGFALFREPALNAQLQKILNSWCVYLSSADSCTYLNTNDPTGWFSSTAFDSKPTTGYSMEGIQCDPSLPHWGFISWNDFFTRRFNPGARPVAEPDNPKVVISACEATPYNIQDNVSLQDYFWFKSQPYSLEDIFTNQHRELARTFEQGTVYQAFLSAYNYHRWHAPICGTIVAAYNVPGTYYSEAESQGLDPAGPNDSQGYITAVAARAIVVIQSDHRSIGEVACVFIGMAEVSSCNIQVYVGQHVNKGDELGYFQFGGSTHCLIFQQGVIKQFVPRSPFDPNALPMHVNAQIATAN
ncbi:phosphatidylserine decarboxylase family protein [Chitinivorax sp. B]|uniref:phosphatidylserine decarboxylase family protein n=1 Tax=Chitinivorax sp. B TaxID=2502235 RepID=UPI0010F9A288|nr:phosphatidylserine decarboxylase family protein [Chitinivorax sp. B]